MSSAYVRVCVLQTLRVRCTEGMEFYTRSASKVKGRMGHRFMFIDGDKAVSGSYRFVWFTCLCLSVIVGESLRVRL